MAPGSAKSKDAVPEIQYHFIEKSERLERYAPGGFHPVRIGDELKQGRYRVVHKLGSGGHSTTWLTRDTHCNTLAAVKILCADADTREMDMLSIIANAEKSQDRSLVRHILDSFTVSGPNGTHNCLVTEVASSSLDMAKGGGYGGYFQLDVAQAFAAQLTRAVALVHSCGIVHGDIHLDNVLLKLPQKLDLLTDEQLYEEFDAPSLEPISRRDGQPLSSSVPSHVVNPIWLGKLSKEIMLSEARAFLADFGVSFLPLKENKRYHCAAPVLCSPPEALFKSACPVSFPSDIWMLACSIWAIVGIGQPFSNFFGSWNHTIREIVDALGPPPAEWWQKWEARGAHFEADGAPTNGRASETRNLQERFDVTVQQWRQEAEVEPLAAEEKDAFLAMIRPMLSYMPDDRPSIQQVLESEWMQKWALPEYEKVQAGVVR